MKLFKDMLNEVYLWIINYLSEIVIISSQNSIVDIKPLFYLYIFKGSL